MSLIITRCGVNGIYAYDDDDLGNAGDPYSPNDIALAFFDTVDEARQWLRDEGYTEGQIAELTLYMD